MDPQYQPAYSFLANLEFKGASTADDSRPAFETIDKGMEICRSKDDLEELAQIKVLALAKLEGARRLGMAAGELMG
ncbi:mitochondrial import receptor subunit [Nannochloropsis oceanica]